jgi:hypothetical protein
MKFWLRHRLNLMAAAAITALLAVPAAAQTPRPATVEIQTLLAAMEQSGCEFYRNGSWYTAVDARAHLARKLAEVERRHPPRSTDEFIDLVATRSSISGEPYRVRCPGAAPLASATWFRQTLERSRQAAPPAR